MADTGDAMPIGDLDNWRQTFTDDFPTDVPLGQFPAAVSGKWGAYSSGWPDSTGHGTYWPTRVVSIKDGVLTKHLHTETISGVTKHLVAAILPKIAKPHTYGRYAVRWRCDPGLDGYKQAWLLWPDSGHRTEGEIDWPERDLTSDSTMGFVHPKYAAGTTRPPQGWCKVSGDTTVWHTDVIEWSPGLVVFSRDGAEVYRSDAHTPSTAMHWVLQTETEMGDAPPPADHIAGDVQIAWVAVWHWDTTARAAVTARSTSLSAPATATGTVLLSVTTSPDVTQVKWMLSETEIGADTGQPFATAFDSTRQPNGSHQLYVKATDGTVWFNGPTRLIKVANPWRLIAPATATGTVTLAVTAYPWFTGCKWVVDGVEVGGTAGSPTIQWDSRKFGNGVHSIYCKVRSSFGWADGTRTTIIVAN